MILLNEMVVEVMQRERLAGIEKRWQLVEWERAQGKRPFLPKLRQWFNHIHIHITVEIRKPCPDGVQVNN